jgi:hypothetical protein
MITNHAAKQIATVKVSNKKKTRLFCFFIVSCFIKSQRVRTKAFGRSDVICILYIQTNIYCTSAILRIVKHRTPRSGSYQTCFVLQSHNVEPGTRYGNSLLGTFSQQLRKAITRLRVYNITTYTGRRLLSILNLLLRWYPKGEPKRLEKKEYWWFLGKQELNEME